MHAKPATTNARLLLIALTLGATLAAFPFFVFAQGTDTTATDDPTAQTTDTFSPSSLSNNGIFGCLGQGARVANVGTTRAVGGVYVPVNDAAVTLNTGFLVYKECILDGMARKIAESGTTELGNQALRAFETGRNGNAQYVRNFRSDFQPRVDAIIVNGLSDQSTSGLCAAFRNSVRTAVVRNTLAVSRQTNVATRCSLTGSEVDQRALIQGRRGLNNWNEWFALMEPENTPLGAARLTEQQLAITVLEDDRNTREFLGYSGGVFSAYDTQNPLTQRVVTPGFIIANAITQVTGSGYRQLESANEIDQVVANLWGGLSSRLLTSGSGIPGLFVSTGNQPAYADQMVAETRAAVRASAVNAAVVSLSGSRQSEAAYLTAKQGTASALINAINALRNEEKSCWTDMIPYVQTMATSQGATLVIATSTQFSQAIIDGQIREPASTTAAEVTRSQQILNTLDQLIATVTNSASSAAQQQALLQADQILATNPPHTQLEAQQAATQRDSVTSALSTLVNDTRTAWRQSTDPNLGWCNVNNTPSVERWFNAWKQ